MAKAKSSAPSRGKKPSKDKGGLPAIAPSIALGSAGVPEGLTVEHRVTLTQRKWRGADAPILVTILSPFKLKPKIANERAELDPETGKPKASKEPPTVCEILEWTMPDKGVFESTGELMELIMPTVLRKELMAAYPPLKEGALPGFCGKTFYLTTTVKQKPDGTNYRTFGITSVVLPKAAATQLAAVLG
jgi:hypothetical protein